MNNSTKDPKPTKVLLYNHVADVSGAEKSMLLLAETLLGSDGQYQVAMACPPDGTLWNSSVNSSIPKLAVKPLVVGYTKNPLILLRYLWQVLLVTLSLRKVLTGWQPQVIHANSIRAGIIACFATLFLPVKVVVHLRDAVGAGWINLGVRSLFWLRADRLVAISAFVATEFCNPFSKLAKKTVVIHNGIDPARFKAVADQKLAVVAGAMSASVTGTATAENKNIPSHKAAFVVGIAGQITPWKGHIDLIRAIALVKEQQPDIKLLIAGATKFAVKSARYDNLAYKRQLEAEIRRLDLAENVTFTGEVADITAFYADLNLLAVTSWAEPFGRVVIEAMASGCPIVATNAGGIPEILEDGQTGLLVPPKNSAALASAILTVINDHNGAVERAEKAYQVVCTNFTADQTTAAIRELYQNLTTAS